MTVAVYRVPYYLTGLISLSLPTTLALSPVPIHALLHLCGCHFPHLGWSSPPTAVWSLLLALLRAPALPASLVLSLNDLLLLPAFLPHTACCSDFILFHVPGSSPSSKLEVS